MSVLWLAASGDTHSSPHAAMFFDVRPEVSRFVYVLMYREVVLCVTTLAVEDQPQAARGSKK
jgi:hypothetical protein